MNQDLVMIIILVLLIIIVGITVWAIWIVKQAEQKAIDLNNALLAEKEKNLNAQIDNANLADLVNNNNKVLGPNSNTTH